MPIERGHDREAHRDHGAEREQQHDDGDADADQLAARRLLRELRERAGELDLHAAGAGASRDGGGVVRAAWS